MSLPITTSDHYREAERLAGAYKDALVAAEAMPDGTPREADVRYVAISGARSLLDKAQVHATLAVADSVAALRIFNPTLAQRAEGRVHP